jgi:hypothetical protein
MPVGERSALEISTSDSGRGAAAKEDAGAQRLAPGRLIPTAPALAGEAPAGASAAVFHSPQESQCPNQRGCSFPHAVQKKDVFADFGFVAIQPPYAGAMLRMTEGALDGSG